MNKGRIYLSSRQWIVLEVIFYYYLLIFHYVQIAYF